MISLAHKFLFVHVPKTGGNSIQNILKDFSEDRIVTKNDQDGVERFGIESPTAPIRKHSLLADYRAHLAPDVFAGLFKFGCVRNPWERMISNYFSPHRKADEFIRAEFIDLLEKKPTPLTYLTLDGTPDGEIGVDFIMRFENIEADFATICEKIGIGAHPLPHRNASSRKHYSVYFDDELIQLVAAKCRREIDMFGYTFERRA